jgi:superfamily I DNA/RNA helicase
MNKIKPTLEQRKIFHYIDKRKENLLIEARAGAGKTSTVVAAVSLLPKDASITFLAFNKHIQVELKSKLPDYVFCYTSHGLGLSALKRKYGDDIVFEEFKADHHINKKKDRWNLNDEFENYFEQEVYLVAIKKLVNLCRATLTTDKKYVPYIAEKYDIRYSEPKDVKRVLSVLEAMTNDRKTFDFTDMVYLPAIDPKIWMFPQDYVIVDECQDLNRAQQAIIQKILKRNRVTKAQEGRLIAVGDPFQSIYSFAGSDIKSFEWFRKQPNTKILTLTHSFRCGTKIVENAQRVVKDIKAKENAHEGLVREGSILKEARDGDFVLCRTTMPLVKLFFTFLLDKKKAIIKGSDIGISLVEMTKNHKSVAETLKFWDNELKEFEKNLKSKGILNFEDHSGYMSLKDKIGVLDFFGKISKTLPDMKKKIRQVFRDDIEGIMLSTVHKAKGLEAERVFIARPDLLPMNASTKWQADQEKNLEYVAITRAKNELIYDYKWTDVDPEEEREKLKKRRNENKKTKTRRKRKD